MDELLAKIPFETATLSVEIKDKVIQAVCHIQIYPRLRNTNKNTVNVTELKKVVATTTLEVSVPSCPIFLAMI